MIKFKQPAGRSIAVFETGSPNHNEIYIDGEGYDITNLAHKFDRNPKFSTSGKVSNSLGSTAEAGYNLYRDDINANSIVANHFGWGLALSKATSYVRGFDNATITGDTAGTTVQPQNMAVMDPSAQQGAVKRFVDNDGNERIIWARSQFPYNNHYLTSWYYQNGQGGTEVSEKHASSQNFGGGTTNTSEIIAPVMPVCVDGSGEWVAYITHQSRWNGNLTDRPMMGVGRTKLSDNGSADFAILLRNDYHVQYLGKSDVDGEPIFFWNYHLYDERQYVSKYDVSANTTTDLLYASALPTAAGTSLGGRRGGGLIDQGICKYASQTFTDFTSGAAAEDLGFYVPFFDTNYDYHPFYFQWDKSADTFTRNDDITISGDKSSLHYGDVIGGAGDASRHRTVIYNDTIVSGGTRYLTLYTVSGERALHDTLPNARTFITYSCAANDPKTLTYHSKVTIPKTPHNIVYLKDDKSILGVMCHDVLYVYSWDNTNGWELAQTIVENFIAIGRDKTDRIWAIGEQTSSQYVETYILSLDLPTKVTITPASSSYDYTGTTINTSIGVSAFNIGNERIAKTIKLKIDGNSMVFDSDGSGNTGTDSATITTLTNADASKNINIVSSGISDIIANIEI